MNQPRKPNTHKHQEARAGYQRATLQSRIFLSIFLAFTPLPGCVSVNSAGATNAPIATPEPIQQVESNLAANSALYARISTDIPAPPSASKKPAPPDFEALAQTPRRGWLNSHTQYGRDLAHLSSVIASPASKPAQPPIAPSPPQKYSKTTAREVTVVGQGDTHLRIIERTIDYDIMIYVPRSSFLLVPNENIPIANTSTSVFAAPNMPGITLLSGAPAQVLSTSTDRTNISYSDETISFSGWVESSKLDHSFLLDTTPEKSIDVQLLDGTEIFDAINGKKIAQLAPTTNGQQSYAHFARSFGSQKGFTEIELQGMHYRVRGFVHDNSILKGFHARGHCMHGMHGHYRSGPKLVLQPNASLFASPNGETIGIVRRKINVRQLQQDSSIANSRWSFVALEHPEWGSIEVWVVE